MWMCDCNSPPDEYKLHKVGVDSSDICVNCGHYAVWVPKRKYVKFTDSMKNTILSMRESGISINEISREYNTSYNKIKKIIRDNY